MPCRLAPDKNPPVKPRYMLSMVGFKAIQRDMVGISTGWMLTLSSVPSHVAFGVNVSISGGCGCGWGGWEVNRTECRTGNPAGVPGATLMGSVPTRPKDTASVPGVVLVVVNVTR